MSDDRSVSNPAMPEKTKNETVEREKDRKHLRRITVITVSLSTFVAVVSVVATIYASTRDLESRERTQRNASLSELANAVYAAKIEALELKIQTSKKTDPGIDAAVIRLGGPSSDLRRAVLNGAWSVEDEGLRQCVIEAADALELMADFGRPERGQGITAWDRLNSLVVPGSGSNIDSQLDKLLVSLENVEKGLVIAQQTDPADEISVGSCVDDLSFEWRGDLVTNRF